MVLNPCPQYKKRGDKEKNYFQRCESEILGQVTKSVLQSAKFFKCYFYLGIFIFLISDGCECKFDARIDLRKVSTDISK